MKDIKQSFKTHEKWMGEISVTNDFILKEMEEQLNLALLNLQIEDARIEENTGIVPISDHIRRVIDTIHNRVEKLKSDGRAENNKVIQDIKKYIEEREGKIK